MASRFPKAVATTYVDDTGTLKYVDKATGSEKTIQTGGTGSIKRGWSDLLSNTSASGVASSNRPTKKLFGSSGDREEFSFEVGDYIFCSPFHVNHDIDPGAKAYIHLHWSTSGLSQKAVKWKMTITRAKGHGQEQFNNFQEIFIEQQPIGKTWVHMVTECSDDDAIVLNEPDEIILVTVERVTNSTADDNPNNVFLLHVDFHYESSRLNTDNKVPGFYS